MVELSRHKDVLADILSERLSHAQVKLDLDSICFPEQLAFIRDTHPWVTALCSRRSGKTEVCALDLLNTALNNPDTVSLYITLTRANAERIVWSKLLSINEQYKLGGVPNIAKLSLTFPNKSVIFLSGCNDKSELDKFRGLALKLVYIDEAQSFKSFLRELVDDVLGPALADYAGSIKFLGTPPPLDSGFFMETVKSDAYSHHQWTFWQNPFIAKKSGKTHQDLLDRELKRRGVPINHPSIRREWFGEVSIDRDALVFAYDAKVNHFDQLPQLTDYVIAVDLGSNNENKDTNRDTDAIAVIGWHKHYQVCYLVEEFIGTEIGITPLINKLELVIKKYNPLKVVMDTGALGTKIADELRKRYSLPIQAAEKTRKLAFIALLNDAMRTQKLLARSNSRFALDSQVIEWDYDKSTSDKLVIKDEPHSDICDAVLYGFRECLHWLSQAEPPKVNLRTDWAKHSQHLAEESLQRQIDQQQSQDRQDDLFAIQDMDMDANPLSYYVNKRKR